jgi:hypothetical protein
MIACGFGVTVAATSASEKTFEQVFLPVPYFRIGPATKQTFATDAVKTAAGIL